jgi:hypothetical protein
MSRQRKPEQHRLRVAPQLTKAEIRELKRRAAADGRSIAQYVAVLLIEDIKKGKPVIRASHPGRGKTESYSINLSGGILSWAKLETRAKAEMRTRPGYVARVIVESLER